MVPAVSAEAEAWTVRGWADVAVGCIALESSVPRAVAPGAFSGLDEVVRAVRAGSGGQHAARLRRLRRFAGPVPSWYPAARPVAGRIRAVRPVVWQAARLVASFGELLMAASARLPWSAPCPLISSRQLAWGARYRPSPSDDHLTLRLPVGRRLARRTWMCLPGLPRPATVIAEVPSIATPLAQQVWRGIHEGAHLDYLSLLSRFEPAPRQGPVGGAGSVGGVAPVGGAGFVGGAGPVGGAAPVSGAGPVSGEGPGDPAGRVDPAAPSRGEFGTGLLASESYAMAVEMLAAVECVLAREGHVVWQLGAGLIERATRLPGGSAPAAEFADLPTLAEVYLLGPLKVLIGSAALPEEIVGPLRTRWRAACAAYPPAAVFGSAAAELVSAAPGPW
jgi:hypothetical protein